MTTEELNEMYEDMKRDKYIEARHETMLRTDYEQFLEFHAFQVEEMVKAVYEVRKAHKKYGWEFNCEDWI